MGGALPLEKMIAALSLNLLGTGSGCQRHRPGAELTTTTVGKDIPRGQITDTDFHLYEEAQEKRIALPGKAAKKGVTEVSYGEFLQGEEKQERAADFPSEY